MYSIGSLSRRKAKPDPWARLGRWLGILVIVWIFATWYVETRMDRFVMSDENLAAEGSFDDGLPAMPNWEYGGLSGEIWDETEGIDGSGAIRLGGGSTPVLRFRKGSAWQADGYFLGFCLRSQQSTSNDGATPTVAATYFRRADTPTIKGPAKVLFHGIPGTQWQCVLETMSVPLVLDELVIEIRQQPGAAPVWVDRFTLRPAVHPPLYETARIAVVLGWVVIVLAVLPLVFRSLGTGLGFLVLIPGGLSLVIAVASTDMLSGLSSWAGPVLATLSDFSEALFEAVRIFSGDRSWRTVGEIQPVSALTLFSAGILAALAVMLRFRWAQRPWRWTLWYATLFGLSVQAFRLLFHTPSYATANWISDPLAVVLGILLGGLLFEFLLRPRYKKLPPTA